MIPSIDNGSCSVPQPNFIEVGVEVGGMATHPLDPSTHEDSSLEQETSLTTNTQSTQIVKSPRLTASKDSYKTLSSTKYPILKSKGITMPSSPYGVSMNVTQNLKNKTKRSSGNKKHPFRQN